MGIIRNTCKDSRPYPKPEIIIIHHWKNFKLVVLWSYQEQQEN